MWFSLFAISTSDSGANSLRTCSSAFGGTIRSAVDPPLAGTSILASRCPLVATMRIRSGRSSHSTPLRIGRLSSVDAANATCATSLWTSSAGAFQALSNFTGGNDGNSSRGRPRSLNFERPHSRETRCSPAVVTRIGADGSSRTMSESFLAGRVTAPSASTSAATVVLTAMSRSVPERRSPCFVASTRTLDRTGSVVLAGTAAATATSPSCNRSRVIVNFMPLLPYGATRVEKEATTLHLYKTSSSSRGRGNVYVLPKHRCLRRLPLPRPVGALWGVWTHRAQPTLRPRPPHWPTFPVPHVG